MHTERLNPEPPHDNAELAELYAAGALTEQETREFEARVRSGDADLRRELDRVRPVLEALLGGDEAAVAGYLRERIEAGVRCAGEPADREMDELSRAAVPSERALAAVGGGGGGGEWGDEEGAFGAHDSDAIGSEGLFILRASEGRWRATGIRGVRYRTLSTDRKSNRRTFLLRMDAGALLPDHDHASTEEIYLVQGDLKIGEQILGAGDYFRATPGARHGTPVSPNGCVCIVISGYVPFPLTSWFGFAWAALRGLFSRRAKP